MSQTVSRLRPNDGLLASLLVPEELIGFGGLPELLGVSAATAARYANRDDFPRPLGVLSSGRVWRQKDVTAWARRTLPLKTGRPRKDQ